MKGIVTKSTGSWYTVFTDDKKAVQCRIKGKFRLEGMDTTNPVAVGDEVVISNGEGGDAYVISEILPRRNYIVRQSPKHENARHIIAANLDQAFLMVTITQPRTSTGFIDRFLLTAEAYHIPTYILFNKQDVLKEKDLKKQQDIVNIYQNVGYGVLLLSVQTGMGMNAIKGLMEGKVTLLAGHSGVGKSTFVNHLHPTLELKTAEISKKFKKGLHTTTFAEMHKLPFGGYVIDTPGVKEFGVLEIAPEEVSHYFPEMRERLGECRFSNCLHVNEPDCAVIEAVRKEEISDERYLNYLNILSSIQ